MFLQLLILKNSFLEFYNKNIDSTLCLNQFNNFLNIECYIFLCKFLNLFNNGSEGGAILFNNNNNYELLIEECIFINCSSSKQGGAIFFKNSGSCILNKICGSKCFTLNNEYYPFAHIGITNLLKSELHDISISECFSTNSNTWATINLENGIIKIYNLNSSLNKHIGVTGIYIFNPSTLNSSYNTFYNNSAIDRICLCLYNGNGLRQIKFTNIIKNNSPKLHGVIYSYGGDFFLSNFFILNNFDTLFYIDTHSITFSNSYYYHPNFNFKLGSGVLNQNNITSTLIIPIENKHLYQNKCFLLNSIKFLPKNFEQQFFLFLFLFLNLY